MANFVKCEDLIVNLDQVKNIETWESVIQFAGVDGNNNAVKFKTEEETHKQFDRIWNDIRGLGIA